MATKHPGFKAVQSSIAKKEGVSKNAAGAILASATRGASPAAKRANPALNNVPMRDGGLAKPKVPHGAKVTGAMPPIPPVKGGKALPGFANGGKVGKKGC